MPTAAVLSKLRGVLAYEKRKQGWKGRALVADVPELGLRGGDRLEASISMQDLGAVDTMAAPCDLLHRRGS